MNDKEKLNQIGRMLADMAMDIKIIKRSQEQLKEYLTNPDKLDFERYWQQHIHNSQQEGKNGK